MTMMRAALAWNALGLQWMQMMAASGQAIARRTQRAQSPAQVLAMGGEKLSAAVESSASMARHAMLLPWSSAPAMWGAWARLLTAGMTPYRVRAVRNARPSRRR